MVLVEGKNKADCDGMKCEICVDAGAWIGHTVFAVGGENVGSILFGLVAGDVCWSV